MNLSAVVGPYIAAINPMIKCCIRQSIGAKPSADGTLVPQYAQFPDILCQAQPLSSTELKMIDALNLQGIYQAMYINGRWSGIDRREMRGGDLITTPDDSVWLIVQVLEQWPEWCKVAVTKQMDGAS